MLSFYRPLERLRLRPTAFIMAHMKSFLRILPLLLVLAGAYYWFLGRSLLGHEMPDLGEYQVISAAAEPPLGHPQEGWRLFAFFQPG